MCPFVPKYTVSFYNRLNRLWLRPTFRALFHFLGRVKIIGLENIPARGNYIVAINHISLYEPPFVLAFWPVPLEAIGAVEIWSKPVQSLLARLYGGIQAHRGTYDRALIELALSALQAGYCLLIAPEGGRSHKPGLRRGLPGVAYLAHKTGLPVIPVGIVGSTDDFLSKALRGQRPPIEMHIGEPFHLPPIDGRGAERRTSLQENADLVMKKIAELLPLEYRGVYADQTIFTKL